MNLSQFIKTFDFTTEHEEASNADNRYASKTVRVFNSQLSDPENNWFEIGQYDFGEGSPLLNALNEKYLEANVSSMTVNDELGCLEVWIDVVWEMPDDLMWKLKTGANNGTTRD